MYSSLVPRPYVEKTGVPGDEARVQSGVILLYHIASCTSLPSKTRSWALASEV